MTRRRTPAAESKPIEQYTHTDKDRVNIPPVGLVTPDTDKDGDKQTYQYDPHLDPQLQWTGKAERTSLKCRPSACTFTSGLTRARSSKPSARKKSSYSHRCSR